MTRASVRALRDWSARWISAVGIAGLFGVTVAAMADPLRRGAPWWNVANNLGLGALFLLGLCFAVNIRRGLPQPFAPGPTLRMHRGLGYAALCLIGLHIGTVLYAEPLVLSDVTPRAPVGMLMALGGAILALGLLFLTFDSVRARQHQDSREFRTAHRLLGISILGASVYHAVAAGFHVDSPERILLLTVLAILLALRPLRELQMTCGSIQISVPGAILLTAAIVAFVGLVALGLGLVTLKDML